MWQRLDRPGLEHVALEVRPDFLRAQGSALPQLDAGLVQLCYRGPSTNFEAEVANDADQIVVDYPPGWKRRGG